MKNLKKYKLVNIYSIKNIKNNGTVVYDISVKNDNSYTANKNIVHNCTTSANAAIGYPMASLIKETYNISCEVKGTPAKIIADGGFRNYSDIIKALFLGSDYVMLGGIFAKCVESPGKYYAKYTDTELTSEKIQAYNTDIQLEKMYRGMSTKEVQKILNSETIKTSEGISKKIDITDSLYKWTENFEHYLRSAMSYTGHIDLNSFKGNTNYTLVTFNALNRYNK